MPTIRSQPVSFRVLPDVKRALERAAKDDHRSVSSLVELILANWLRAKGYLKDRPPKA